MSWAELIAIREEQRQLAEADRNAPLVECPICGERLDVRDGIKNCPLGHWRSTRTTREG